MSAYSALLVAQGASNHFPLDEATGATATDVIGGTVLTQFGTPATRGVLAAEGFGMVFPGTGQSTLISDVNNAQMTFNSAFGFSFSWVMRADITMVGAGAVGLISKRNSSSLNRTFSVFMQGSEGGALNIDFGTNQIRWGTGFVPTQGQVFHVAVTWDPNGGVYTLYVNGQANNSVSGRAPNSQLAPAPFYLGALGAASPNQLFPGLLDEVAVWDRKTLSAAEVRAQYDSLFPLRRVLGADGIWRGSSRKVF